MNVKQFGWVGFILLNIASLLFDWSWWWQGACLGLALSIIVFLILTAGYFSYSFYRHLGDDPIELIGPTELFGWYIKGLRSLASKARN